MGKISLGAVFLDSLSRECIGKYFPWAVFLDTLPGEYIGKYFLIHSLGSALGNISLGAVFLIHFIGQISGRIRICILVLMFGQRMFYNVYIRPLWSAAHRFSDGPCSLYTGTFTNPPLIIVIFGGMTFLLSTRVGSQITVANHVSRPIAPSPWPNKGDTRIL